jgi:hypothetical protein
MHYDAVTAFWQGLRPKETDVQNTIKNTQLSTATAWTAPHDWIGLESSSRSGVTPRPHPTAIRPSYCSAGAVADAGLLWMGAFRQPGLRENYFV